APAPARSVLVIVDVSRSMIESRRLSQKALASLFRSLGPKDRFQVMTMDIGTRELMPAFAAPADARVEDALGAVSQIEPDGASDLEAALRRAGELFSAQAAAGRALQLVYIGDGRPTWGETDPSALRRLASTVLPGVEIHGLALGRETDLAFLNDLAGDSG